MFTTGESMPVKPFNYSYYPHCGHYSVHKVIVTSFRRLPDVIFNATVEGGPVVGFLLSRPISFKLAELVQKAVLIKVLVPKCQHGGFVRGPVFPRPRTCSGRV